MATVIAYVDGFNLYHGLRDRYRRRYLWLDLEHMVKRLRPKDDIAAVRYFTALVRDEPAALARQQAYLDALSVYSSNVEIILGRFQAKDVACRQCGSVWRSYEEKETDVNIAVSLVADAAAAASDIALIISADSDLCPAIRTARSLNSRLGLIAAFPPRRSSFEIRSLIRAHSLLPQSICATRFCLTPSATRLPAVRTSDPASGDDLGHRDGPPAEVLSALFAPLAFIPADIQR